MRDAAKHPWVSGKLRVVRGVLERVFAEAVAGYARDEESCGVLVGPIDQPLLVDGIVTMENRASKLHGLDPETYPRTARTYFDLNPMVFEREVREREERGHPVKVLYHSHLDAGAYFSETDAAAATMGGPEPTYDLAYLVTSVRAGQVDGYKLFVWDGDGRTFIESTIEVASEVRELP